jgi:hypothetical protein
MAWAATVHLFCHPRELALALVDSLPWRRRLTILVLERAENFQTKRRCKFVEAASVEVDTSELQPFPEEEFFFRGLPPCVPQSPAILDPLQSCILVRWRRWARHKRITCQLQQQQGSLWASPLGSNNIFHLPPGTKSSCIFAFQDCYYIFSITNLPVSCLTVMEISQSNGSSWIFFPGLGFALHINLLPSIFLWFYYNAHESQWEVVNPIINLLSTYRMIVLVGICETLRSNAQVGGRPIYACNDRTRRVSCGPTWKPRIFSTEKSRLSCTHRDATERIQLQQQR